MDDDDLVGLAWCDLLCAVILRALKDFKDGRLCNAHCKNGEHVCCKDALNFLESEGASHVLDGLEVDPGVVKDIIFYVERRSNMTTKKGTKEPEGTDQQLVICKCKLCDEEMPEHHLGRHLWTAHVMTLQEHETWQPGQLRARVVETGKFERIPPPPPPAPRPPEPVIEVKLADVPTNPNSESVRGRRGTSYLLSKREWTPVPVPDLWRIVGTEDIPSRYPYLKFETREPSKKQGKKTKK